jgi:hypothetical protein
VRLGAFLNRPSATKRHEIRGFAQSPSRVTTTTGWPVSKIRNHVEHFRRHLGIKRRGRLVHQEELRFDSQSPGDRDALALPAAQLRRCLARVDVQAQAFQNAMRALPCVSEAVNLLQREKNILKRSQMRKEIESLKYYADLSPMLGESLLFKVKLATI